MARETAPPKILLSAVIKRGDAAGQTRSSSRFRVERGFYKMVPGMFIDRLKLERRQLMLRADQCISAGQDRYALVLLRKAMRIVDVNEALSNSDVARCLFLMGEIKLRDRQDQAANAYFTMALYVTRCCEKASKTTSPTEATVNQTAENTRQFRPSWAMAIPVADLIGVGSATGSHCESLPNAVSRHP
jgi:hypothetical protein